ncbi:MAG: PspC domain-containing protein [Bacteroidia bacterium]|nr:PspC domain-containing protein [Bacteroidia bacterium]MCF8428310.1 PspC domain-containing protein [Bacteroidia bacterium]
MEKVFQIHLAGMLFTIEEQAYHVLKSYLGRLHQHFASNSEVVQDIEGRMAELFAQKLGSNRNTLFLKDINEVTQIMGDINQMDEHGEVHAKEETKSTYTKPMQRKLRRHPSDQTLGGVCSGLGSFFDVDPVIVRVLFVLLLVIYGSGVLLYLVLWAVLPEARGEEAEYMRMQKENRSKRLYRDSDSRVIGGVATGLSYYFGIDRAWIRLAFVITIFFFGTGFWLYIVLWLIVPKAISASDKLLMRGEPADIHNIEKQVMQNQASNKINSIAEHGSNLIGKIIKGFLKFIGAVVGLILFATIVGLSISMVAIFFNLGKTHFLNELIQFTVTNSSLIWIAKVGVLLTLIVPVVGLFLVIIRGLFNISFINRYWAMTLISLFLIGVIFMAYSGISFGTSVSHNESKVSLNKIAINDTLILEGIEMPYIEENEEENDIEMVFRDKGVIMGKSAFFFEIDKVTLKQGKSDSVVLKVVRRANGSDRRNANLKMDMIEFTPKIIGNKIIIPSYFSLAKDKQFSWQEVDVTLYVPEGKVIQMDMNVMEILDDNYMNEADGSIYTFQKGELICLDCGSNVETEDYYGEDEDDNSSKRGRKNNHIKFKIGDGDENANIEININEDDNSNGKKKTSKVIKKDGKTIKIEETHDGPVTIKKRIEIDK